MIETYPAANTVTFLIDYENNGTFIRPASSSYVIYDEDGGVVKANTVLDVSNNPRQAKIVLSQVETDIGTASRAYRQLVLVFTDAGGNQYRAERNFMLEKADIVAAGVNSFASYGQLILTSADITGITAFNDAAIMEQRAALISAWHNIGNVRLHNLGLGVNSDQSYITSLPYETTHYNSKDLTAELLGQLDADILLKLKRAQVVEANFLLGGNPVEDRRRTGMISDSSGESAQFFRTSRPVELPICKEAANEMRGLVDWTIPLRR